MSYIIEWNNNGVKIIYDGDLNIKELFKVSGLIINDSRYVSLTYVISDFQKVTGLAVSKMDIKEMSTFHVIPSILNPNLKFSIVSNNNAILGNILEYIELMKENEWEIKLFDNQEDLDHYYKQN